jgi:DNA-binding Lrp family transcriptional regulator
VISAFVLIQAEVGKSSAVGKAVDAIGGVKAANVVSGPYDVIAEAEAENIDELGRLVVAKIQGVEGVMRTLTCPVIHV